MQMISDSVVDELAAANTALDTIEAALPPRAGMLRPAPALHVLSSGSADGSPPQPVFRADDTSLLSFPSAALRAAFFQFEANETDEDRATLKDEALASSEHSLTSCDRVFRRFSKAPSSMFKAAPRPPGSLRFT